MMMRVFAVTTRGLEAVSAVEMSGIPGMQAPRAAYRRVTAEYNGPVAALAGLRTVDDVFLEAATWGEIGRQRNALDRLQVGAAQLDLSALLGNLPGGQPTRERRAFSVTANFVGKRNYNTAEIKQAVAEGVTARYGWAYQEEDTSRGVNLRVFIEHEQAYVGIRLFDHPLHKRPYKQVHITGSLKPPVAAALLSLAGAAPGQRVVDPTCGAGTILIEAAILGCLAQGGDIDQGALHAARSNAAAGGARVDLAQWDAQALPFATRSIERIVANLPWGHQVAVDDSLAAFYRQTCSELQRVLARAGRVVLLTSLPELVQFRELRLVERLEIGLFGQRPSVLVFAGVRAEDY